MAIPLKVLLIEDSDSDAELDVRALEKAGYKVTHEIVATAEEMKAALDKQVFDLIIADHNLPKFDSLKALVLLKKSGQDIPFIVVSDSIGEETVVKIMKAGAHDYVMKDNLNRLGAAVERELRVVEARRERKKAAEELNIQNSLLAAILNSSEDIISFSLDREYCYMSFNGNHQRAMRKVWNADIKIGMNMLDCMTIPELRAAAKQSIDRTLTGVSFTEESFQPDKGIFYEFDWNPIRRKDKSIIGVTCFVRDVTERTRAEQTLRMYKQIVNTTEELMSFIDKHYVYQAVNDANCKACGKTNEEIVGHSVEAIWGTEAFEEHIRCNLDQCLAGREVNYEAWLDYPALGKRYVDVTFYPFWDSMGDISGVVACSRDITERKKAEEKLLNSYEMLKKTLDDAINTLVKVVEMRDPYTAGHQRKVALLAVAIARKMNLEDTRIDQLRMAAVIHDVGKMYVPSDILSKPVKLSDIEFDLIRTHAQGGYEIVKGMNLPGVVARVILQHHERLDCSGYPNRLKGEDTLLESKILAVADVIEAMASHRPYRSALGIDKALEEISRNKGKLYDPDVVDTCLELFNTQGFKLE